METDESMKIDFDNAYRAYEGMTLDKVDALPMAEDSCCRYCVNHFAGTNRCFAFLFGIPGEYLSGEKKHDKLDGRELYPDTYKFDLDFLEY